MREKLATLPLTELKEIAKSKGLKEVSTIRKSALIDRLIELYEEVKKYFRICCRIIPRKGARAKINQFFQLRKKHIHIRRAYRESLSFLQSFLHQYSFFPWKYFI